MLPSTPALELPQTQAAYYSSLFLVTAYLTCEALFTQSLATPLLTDAAALLALDAVSQSWHCATTTVILTRSSGEKRHLLRTRVPRREYVPIQEWP